MIIIILASLSKRILILCDNLLFNIFSNCSLRLMAFGAGRRVCVGEVLARNRLFLLVTSLLQRFHFKAEADDKLPVFDPREYESGAVLTPPLYKVRLITATSD